MNRNVVAAFIRFVICGGGVGLLSGGALMLLTGSMSIAVANAVVTVVSTLLCNELHSRITFRKGAASLRVHVESTGTAVVAYLFTTTAMLVLDAVAPHAGALTQQAVYLSASGLAGLGRFVVLRLVVFARKADKVAAVVTVAPATAAVATPIGAVRIAADAASGVGAGRTAGKRIATAPFATSGPFATTVPFVATAPFAASAGITAAGIASAGIASAGRDAAARVLTSVPAADSATDSTAVPNLVPDALPNAVPQAFSKAVRIRPVRPVLALSAVNDGTGAASGTGGVKAAAGAKTWKSRTPRPVVFGALVASGGRTTVPAREVLVAAA